MTGMLTLIESFKMYNWMSDDSITDSVEYAKKEGGIVIKDSIHYHRQWAEISVRVNC